MDFILFKNLDQCYKTFWGIIFNLAKNRVFFPAQKFSPSLMFLNEAIAYPSAAQKAIWICIHNTWFSLLFTPMYDYVSKIIFLSHNFKSGKGNVPPMDANRPNELGCYFTRLEGLPGTNKLAFGAHS
jgi:hypothetical protein